MTNHQLDPRIFRTKVVHELTLKVRKIRGYATGPTESMVDLTLECFDLYRDAIEGKNNDTARTPDKI